MSLLLSGCLGRAQLGAAELGAFQTVTVGAGFLPIFPDVGPLKQAEAPENQRKKKRKITGRKAEDKRKLKKPKKAKKQKRIAVATESSTIPLHKTATESQPITLQDAIPLLTQSVDTAAERLRETIAEEDELLLLIC